MTINCICNHSCLDNEIAVKDSKVIWNVPLNGEAP